MHTRMFLKQSNFLKRNHGICKSMLQNVRDYELDEEKIPVIR